VFDWIYDVGTWSADNLVAPVVTGLFVGLALRWAAIAGEPSTHDAKADEMNSDLSRWVTDRERQLQAEIFGAKNLAEQGIIEDVVGATPVPKKLEGAKPGSKVDSGAFIRRIERLMRQALHEYRDDASLKVRTYRSMARSEGWVHKLLRRGRRANREPSPFRLTDSARELLASWREREVPSYYKADSDSEGRSDPGTGCGGDCSARDRRRPLMAHGGHSAISGSGSVARLPCRGTNRRRRLGRFTSGRPRRVEAPRPGLTKDV
jgi:hypothetical protein